MESCWSRSSRLLLQHLAVADDGVQRRSQLVAHVGEELALGTVRRLGRILRLQQLLLGALVGGDVAEHRDAVVQHAFLVFERRGVDAQPDALRSRARDEHEHFGRVDSLAADRLHQRKLIGRIRRDHVGQVEAVRDPPTRASGRR